MGNTITAEITISNVDGYVNSQKEWKSIRCLIQCLSWYVSGLSQFLKAKTG